MTPARLFPAEQRREQALSRVNPSADGSPAALKEAIMTKSVLSKTLAAVVAIALVAGSSISSAEAKDGRRTAAILGALAGIAGVLVEAHVGQSDGYRPGRPHPHQASALCRRELQRQPLPRLPPRDARPPLRGTSLRPRRPSRPWLQEGSRPPHPHRPGLVLQPGRLLKGDPKVPKWITPARSRRGLFSSSATLVTRACRLVREDCMAAYLVRTAGIEPAQPFGPRDFKSLASTSFATSAYLKR